MFVKENPDRKKKKKLIVEGLCYVDYEKQALMVM